MQIWAIANQKGGVGKTTTAISLAGLLARRGERVLLLDLDPHGSLTSYFRHDPESEPASIYTLFQRRIQSQYLDMSALVCRSTVDGIDLICAHTAMATLDRQLGARAGMGRVVVEALNQLQNDYSRVLIDCPPMLGVLMVNALAACTQLLIPVQTEFLALKGLDRMMRTVSMVSRSRGNAFRHLIVPTLFDRRTRAAMDALRQLRETHGEQVWKGVIPVDTQFREASQLGTPLPTIRPGARGSRAYGQLLDWLDGRTRSLPMEMRHESSR